MSKHQQTELEILFKLQKCYLMLMLCFSWWKKSELNVQKISLPDVGTRREGEAEQIAMKEETCQN